MLDGLERKLVAVVADAVMDRDRLDVVQLAGPGDDPVGGRTVAGLGVEAVAPETGFDRDVIEISGSEAAPVSRRVLPVRFTATARFATRPVGPTTGERTAARLQLLGDVSAVAHALDDTRFIAGAAFAVTGDPGFAVRAFRLSAGEFDPDPVAGDDPALLRAVLRWEGRAAIWPTAPPAAEEVVRAVDVELTAVPIALSAREPVVRQGGSTVVTIAGVAGRRTTGGDPPASEPIAVAVSVTSDLPPADRGHVEGGTAGTEPGVRVVPVAASGTAVTYTAPSATLGAVRVEFVSVHLATTEGARGVFIDALPIRLVPS